MSRFEGKGVIVTGAASGISAASVSKFLEEGAYVVIADIDEAAEQQNSTFIQCDVTDHLSVEILINSVNDWLKGQGVQLDVLFNNAGIVSSKSTPDLSIEEWQRVIGVDLNSVFYACVLPSLLCKPMAVAVS